jgi:hypothetical protein
MLEAFQKLDRCACRMGEKRHTSATGSGPLIRRVGRLVAEEAKTRCGLLLSGGVFHGDGDMGVWFYSCGEEVTVECRGEVDLPAALKVAEQGMRAVRHLFVPRDPRFRHVLTEARGYTVVAATDIAQNAVVGLYHGCTRLHLSAVFSFCLLFLSHTHLLHAYFTLSLLLHKPLTYISCTHLSCTHLGYIRHKFQHSNPCYNGPIVGSEGAETIDPTLGWEDILPELGNIIVPYLNEPPPGNQPNCLWHLRPSLPPQILAARDIPSGEELFLYYGTGYPRTYPIQEGLVFQEVISQTPI